MITETEYRPVVTYVMVEGPCWIHWRHADMAIGDVICTEVMRYRRVLHDGVWWGYSILGVVEVPIEQVYRVYFAAPAHDDAHAGPLQPPADPFAGLA